MDATVEGEITSRGATCELMEGLYYVYVFKVCSERMHRSGRRVHSVGCDCGLIERLGSQLAALLNVRRTTMTQ